MWRNSYSLFLVGLCLAVPVGGVFLVGCSKGQEAGAPPGVEARGPGGERGGGRGGPGGGPGGRGGGQGGGGRFAPVSATATASEIFQQKCSGCHGDQGQGARGPNLSQESQKTDAAIVKIIHDGQGRMPAFGQQMTMAQITTLASYVKHLTPAK